MADVGTGATLTFGTSSDTFSIVNMQWSGQTWQSIDITNLSSTTAMAFMPGDLYDPGQLTATVLYDPDVRPTFTAGTTYLSETVTLTYPIPIGKSGGATAAASGFLLNFDQPSLAVDQRMEATMTWKLTGIISFTASTS